MQQILLLEDDQSFGYILSEYLSMHGYEIHWKKSGEEALAAIEEQHFSLAILDIMLPGIDGFEVAKTIRIKQASLPFIFLSAKSLKIDKLKGYKAGAFDYITKPVDEELLLAKIKVLISNQRTNKPQTNEYELGQYRFLFSLQKLIYQDESTKLTSREAVLLQMLCEHKNQLLPRKKALKEIWGNVDEFSRKSMDVFISHLRKYLSKDKSISIENIHGKGFVLKIDERKD